MPLETLKGKQRKLSFLLLGILLNVKMQTEMTHWLESSEDHQDDHVSGACMHEEKLRIGFVLC